MLKFTTVALTLTVAGKCFLASAEELYSYKAYGQNKSNGLFVAATIWEADKNGNLRAKVQDELLILNQCWGVWTGMGIAQVGCENGIQYILKVVEGEK